MTSKPRRWRRVLLRIVGATVTLYLVFLAVVYYAMCQPPPAFGSFMKRLPMPVFLVVPFEPMWNRARGGPLRVGDVAPDFELPTADGASTVRLSRFRGSRPVVLVFGSYT